MYLISVRSILILSPLLLLGLPSGLFPSGFPTKSLRTPLICPYTLHAQPITFFSILSHKKYWVSSTDHSAPHYIVFSTPLLLIPLRPKIFPSAPHSQTPSTYVPHCERPSFKPRHNNRQHYSSVYLNL